MAIETTIRNQIIAKSGLQGTALEELKECLAKMNEEELKVGLSRQLSCKNDTTEMGIKV
jgi:hypothetical protein